MQNETAKIAVLVVISTLIFLLMPVFLILYIRSYNRHKKNHHAEKLLMREIFESEMLKARVEVQDQTMQSIATELHDNVGQLLSLTTLTLNSVNLDETEKAAKKIENSLSLVNKSIKELRELAKLLHGEQLVSDGIGHAIEQELNWLNKSGVFEIKAQNDLLKFEQSSPDKDLIILRLIQEILNNIIKHAQATHIEIKSFMENDMLFIRISENGIGFDYDEARKNNTGMGLNSIHKRMEMINGKLILNSAVGQGTSISLEIPYP